MKKSTGSKLVKQGLFLALATFIVRFIGFLYRIPLTRILGDEGNGLYGSAFTVYSFILVIASNGIPIVVSKNVSERLAKRRRKDAETVFYATLLFSAVVSSFAAILLVIFAKNIASVLQMPDAVLPLRILAPTIVLVAVKGVFFGYFQGRKTTVPTAISQIIEQLVNAIVSIVFAYVLISRGAMYGASGSTLGTLIGALLGLGFLLILFLAYRKQYKYKLSRDTSTDLEPFNQVLKMVSFSIFQIAIGSAVFQITGLLDTFMLSNGLHIQGYSSLAISKMQGIFSGKYKVLTTVPIAVGPAIAAVIVPSLAASNIKKDIQGVNNKIHLTLKYLMLFAIPSAIGLFVLANPIMTTLFHDPTNMPSLLLQIGSASVIFYCLSTITINILQSLGKINLPIRNLWIALGIKVVLNIFTIYIFDFNLPGVVATGVIFSVISSTLNILSIKKLTSFRLNLKEVFVVPLLAGLIMAVTTLGAYVGLVKLMDRTAIVTIICIVIAVCVYGVSVLVLGGVTREEIKMFPMSGLILKVCSKLRIVRDRAINISSLFRKLTCVIGVAFAIILFIVIYREFDKGVETRQEQYRENEIIAMYNNQNKYFFVKSPIELKVSINDIDKAMLEQNLVLYNESENKNLTFEYVIAYLNEEKDESGFSTMIYDEDEDIYRYIQWAKKQKMNK